MTAKHTSSDTKYKAAGWWFADNVCVLSLTAGGSLDLKSLCVLPGKMCWVVYVDALLLNDGGNVLDALSIAARAALALTRIPKVVTGGTVFMPASAVVQVQKGMHNQPQPKQPWDATRRCTGCLGAATEQLQQGQAVLGRAWHFVIQCCFQVLTTPALMMQPPFAFAYTLPAHTRGSCRLRCQWMRMRSPR